MIYEFIATISAGFAMAGFALIIRHILKLLKTPSPKWLIPIFAGIGMLGFQIHQEYHWHEQQIEKLPKDAQVIKLIEGKTWFRPWSYVKPQVIRFMAVATDKTISNPQLGSIKSINIYLFERRISTKIVPQFINCDSQTIADPFEQQHSQETTDQPATDSASANTATESSNSPTAQRLALSELNWHPLKATDPLLKAVCGTSTS
ncbi:hypothetical protein A6J60_006050 [Psychrobacter sp. FDAARGOS_221]|nr:hypothetical protein A6J60_006050 [Psychrobacter sp. FDAARGOS_221]